MSCKRSRNPEKIAPFKEYIISRLNEHPLTASRIYREIRENGFTGKYGKVKNFVREVRPKQNPESKVKLIGGQIIKLYCFTMVFGFSRIRFAEFTLKIDVLTLIRRHLNAFGYFGGYPQEILYDNMIQIVLNRKPVSSDSKYDPKFED